METLKVIDIQPDEAKKLAQRLHRKKDEINLIRKTYIVEKGEVLPDERAIVARVSTPDRDRDGEIVEPKGIDVSHYNSNPILLWAHRYDQPPIGRAMWTRSDDKGLLAKFQFANTQFADEIYSLYRDGFLKTFSIGFIPLDFDSIEKVHKKISLLEVSAVPVPSNPNAKVEAMQKGLITCEQLKKDMGIEEVQEPIAQTEQEEPILQDTAQGEPLLQEKDNEPDEAVLKEDDDEGFKCECIECGHTVTAEPGVHCRDLKCSKCGGEMRRAERPGPGKDAPPTSAHKEAPDITALFDHLNERMDSLMQTMEMLKPLLTPAPVVEPRIEIVIDPPADVLTIDPSPTPAPKQVLHDLNPDEIEAAITAAVKRLDMTKQINEGIALALDKLRGRVR